MERHALEELYEITIGIHWYKKWNWCSAVSYSKWDGLKVDNGGHLISLDLRQYNLQGTLSLNSLPSFPRLINIKVLNLSENSISGCVPNTIASLEALEILDLSWNKFSGPFPELVCHLRLLKILRLEHNNFSGELPNTLALLRQLVHLNLSYNKFSGCMPDVGHRLAQLKILDLAGNAFEGINCHQGIME
jgi:hypothetical protein